MSTATHEEPEYKPGDRVEHAIFGKGTVKEWKPHRGEPLNGFLVIAFDDHGTKELVTAFTAGKLKRIPRRGEKA